MIRFGPAGIPLSCKGRTLRDGVEDVHNLSLTAMEVQMVHPSSMEIEPAEEYIGMRLCDVPDALALEIYRDDDLICDPETVIDEDDTLVVLYEEASRDLAHNITELREIGDFAKRLDVALSVHTPHYIDLGTDDARVDEYVKRIRHAGIIANALQGGIVTTTLGLYEGKLPDDQVDDNIINNLDFIIECWKDNDLKPKIGLEITGRQEAYGSLDQILDLCDEFGDVVTPVLNFSHYHSRNNGCLREVEDFENVIQQVLPYNNGKLYAHFAGTEHENGNELRLTPIKKGDLKYELLADCFADSKPEATVISSSPLLEHDAMYMRIIYERAINKRVAKALRARKKEMELANAASASSDGSAEPAAPKKKKAAKSAPSSDAE